MSISENNIKMLTAISALEDACWAMRQSVEDAERAIDDDESTDKDAARIIRRYIEREDWLSESITKVYGLRKQLAQG